MRLSPLLRSMLREPRTALPALLLLALGLGGFAWMLALHRSLMLRSYPVPQPERLVRLWNGMKDRPSRRGTPSAGQLGWMREYPQVFSGVAAWAPESGNLGQDLPVQVKVDRCTGDLLEVLGVQPALGCGFTAADDAEGAPATALVTDTAWRQYLGADPSIIGRPILLNGRPVEVRGVLPRGFHTPHGTDLFVPFRWTLAQRTNFNKQWLRVVARLQPGVTRAGAEAAMGQLAVRLQGMWLAEGAPEEMARKVMVGVTPLVDEALGDGLKVLRVLRIATAMVLLLAAYNAGALLMARGLGRRAEMAVRSALGADAGDLRRLLMAEGALLGLVGALLGLLGAKAALGPAAGLLKLSFPDLSLAGMALDGPSVAGALVLGPVLGALCALVAQPGERLAQVLRMAGRHQGLGSGRGRRLLVGAQLVLGGALLLGALSLYHGVGKLMGTDLGLRPEGVWTFQISPGLRMPLDERTRIAEAIRERLGAMPGITAVGATNGLPMTGMGSDLNVLTRDGRQVNGLARSLTPGLVQAMGFRLVAGRDVQPTDRAGAEPVMLVTRQFAREAFGREAVLGEALTVFEAQVRIVGILEDLREQGPAKAAPGMFFMPLPQSEALWNENLHVAFRCAGTPPSELQVREMLRQAAPGLALHHFRSVEDSLAEVLGPQRMARAFMAAFATLALLLGAGGVFGLMTASVAARRAEFGVRASFGATPGRILAEVLKEAAVLAILGGVGGILLGFGLDHLGRAALGQWPMPPMVLGLVALGALGGAVLAAAFTPAWRASHVNPIEALRAE